MYRCSVCWHTGSWFTLCLIISSAPIQYDANKEERNPGHAWSPSEISYFVHTPLPSLKLSLFYSLFVLYCIIAERVLLHTACISFCRIKKRITASHTNTYCTSFYPILCSRCPVNLLPFRFLFPFPHLYSLYFSAFPPFSSFFSSLALASLPGTHKTPLHLNVCSPENNPVSLPYASHK